MKKTEMVWKIYKIAGHLLISSAVFMILEACNSADDPIDEQNNDSTNVPVTQVPFDKVPALTDMVIYEVNFMAFGPSCKINDVLNRIDSIKSLGVNVLWLMPIHPEGQVNGVGSPYCVQNYKEVNPDLGTINDLKEFVQKAHQLEMAVILDWVANHTAWDNDWIYNADWYSQDSQGNIISPPGTGWNDVADLDYTNPSMRIEMIKSMKYWVNTCNIDGFRCDAADLVPFDFWKQAIDSLKKLPGRELILLAEGSRTDHFSGGFQMTYAWNFQTALKNIFNNGATAGSLYQVNSNEYNNLPEGTEKLRYITNHDIYAWEDSPVDQFINKQGSLSAFVAAAFLDGVPLICSGQEVAHPATISFFNPNPINWTQNSAILTNYKKVMEIRELLTEVRSGNLITYNNDDVLIFKRTDADSEVLILINVRSSTQTISLPADLIGTSWVDQWGQAEITLDAQISLNPFEFIIARRIP